jgi:hypothetical protein
MNQEILTALKMAQEYAAFAPGKLVPKDMAIDGDACYEGILNQQMMVRFLFPQFAVDKADKEKYSGFVLLWQLAYAASATRAAGARDDAHALHRLRWNAYKQSDFDKILTPFQLALTEFVFGYKEPD